MNGSVMIVHLQLFQTNHTAENIASVNTFKHIKGFFFPMMLHFCAQLFYPIIRSRFLKNSFWVMLWRGTKYVTEMEKCADTADISVLFFPWLC